MRVHQLGISINPEMTARRATMLDQVNKLLGTHGKGEWGLKETLEESHTSGAPGRRGHPHQLPQGPR